MHNRTRFLGCVVVLLSSAHIDSVAAVTSVSTESGPAETSKMVCAAEGQKEIAKALHMKPVRPVTPTWQNHVYSCSYVYATGAIGVSVKELTDESASVNYFNSLVKQRGRRAPFSGIGDAGFVTQDGSAVVRKDTSVLLVDVAKLPKKFGVPPRHPVVAAQAVAGALVNCWTHS